MRHAFLIAFLGLSLLTATAAAAVSPSDLAHKLLLAQYLRSQLPPGFSVGSTTEERQADGQAADVKVNLKYQGNSGDRIAYYVLRDASTAANAFTSLTHPSPPTDPLGLAWHMVPGGLPGSPLPSRALLAKLTIPQGRYKATLWASELVVRQGAVDIYVLIQGTYVRGLPAKRGGPGLSPQSGESMDIALMRSALAHLASVQKPS